MSTTITAENGIEFEVCSLGVSIVDHEEQWKGWARLSPVQRRALADALAPERGGKPPAGGQWTRDDIDRALINVTSNALNYPTPSQMLGKDTGPLRRKCVDAVCDLLGIEAEQAVDPVEAKARELWEVAQGDRPILLWEVGNPELKDDFLRMARHVLGQEATR